MTTLLRFGWRELRRSKARAILIALVLTIQAAALGGGRLSAASLTFTRDSICQRLALADLDVHFVPASATEMPALDAIAKLPGVAAVDRRFVGYGYVELTDGAPLPVVVEYLDPARHPRVDDVEVLSGRWLEPGRPELALIDRSFAAAHGIDPGAELVVNPHRFATRFVVGGVGLSPAHLVPTANPELLVPHKGSLGVVYASREALDRTFPDELYNDVLVTFAPGADPRATTDAVLAALGSLEVERVVTKPSTFGYRFLDVMLAGSRSVAPTIALLVALMAAIVAFVSMHRLVAERRREIGCLLAQGYSPARIAAVFFGLGLVPGVVGAALGVPAAIAFAERLTRTTAAISGFPDPIAVTDHAVLAVAALSAIAAGALSALPATASVLRIQPTDALRGGGEIRFAGLPRFVELLVARVSRPAIRYALRNVFRRVPLSAATVALLALAVALPAGLRTSLASWSTWAEEQERILGWDAIASFKVPLEERHVHELLSDKGVAAFEGYVQGYAPMRRADGVVEEMRVRGIPLGSDIIRFHLTGGHVFTSDDADEAILNTAFSSGRPVRLGETVTLSRHGVERRFVVVGVITDATLSTILLPRHTAQRFLGLDGQLSGVYLRFGGAPPAVAAVPATHSPANAEISETIDGVDDAPPAAAAPPQAVFRDTKTALLDDDMVTNVEVRSEFAAANLRYLAAFQVVILPFLGLSAVLAFVFLLGVLGFLFLERATEYATLRSLGYDVVEVAQIVLGEVTVLGATGLVVSLGTWAATAFALRAPMARTWFLVPLDFRPIDFVVCAAPTALFLLLAVLPGVRGIVRMDLSAALRGRALG